MSHWSTAVAASAVAMAVSGVITFAAPGAATAASQRACFAELTRGRGREIVCEYPVWMTDDERAEMRKWTRDLVHDASCVVAVKIARELVDTALKTPDTVFVAPPQPVTCTVKTATEAFPITGTFAPRVVFKGGVAVEASPVLANVTGVHAAIAWPVVAYVNSSGLISKGLVDAVNAFLTRRQTQAFAR